MSALKATKSQLTRLSRATYANAQSASKSNTWPVFLTFAVVLLFGGAAVVVVHIGAGNKGWGVCCWYVVGHTSWRQRDQTNAAITHVRMWTNTYKRLYTCILLYFSLSNYFQQLCVCVRAALGVFAHLRGACTYAG